MTSPVSKTMESETTEVETDDSTMFMDAEEATLSKIGSSKPVNSFGGRRASLANLRASIVGMGVTLQDMLVRTFSTRKLPQSHSEEEHLLNEMMEELSDSEIEVAARASYEYLMHPDEKEQLKFAKQYALKFLKSKKYDATKAVTKMKETLAFRSDKKVDWIRLAFHDELPASLFDAPVDGKEIDKSAAKQQQQEYAERLELEIQSENCFVQGYDKEGRATYIFVPRNVKGHDDEWTLKEHIYTLERAVTCSWNDDHTVNAIVDFNGFSLKNAPPTHLGKEFMLTFRNHYAGAIHSIFLLDAPYSFWCLWSIFKPLVAEQTREKIHFISSKKNDLEEYYSPDQATPWMMKHGTKTRSLDVQEYLYQTPFDKPFDYKGSSLS